jgi:hypothetical protein
MVFRYQISNLQDKCIDPYVLLLQWYVFILFLHLFYFCSNWIVLVKLVLFDACLVCYSRFLLYRKSSLNGDMTHCFFDSLNCCFFLIVGWLGFDSIMEYLQCEILLVC